jgi:arylsulfatase
MPARRPNILFLMTDQQRWDALGCIGGQIRTPNLDRIAAEGVRFTRCISVSPECIPSRVSLATGLYPHNTCVWENVRYTLPPDSITWMQSLRALGYRTSILGKTHWHPHEGDLRTREHLLRAYGFDYVHEVTGPRASMHCLSHMTARWQERGVWEAFRRDYEERFATNSLLVRPSALPLEEYYDVYVGQQAVHYLQRFQGSEPWFCWVSFPGPHEPWDAPEPYASMYNPEHMPPPLPPEQSRIDRPTGSIDQRPSESRAPEPLGMIQQMRASYAGSVTLIDDQIGEILEVIERRGELDSTIIVFTSDHGEMNGDHGLIYKSTFYRSSVNVPFIIRLPQGTRSGIQGRTCESLVETIDIGPTLAELAGTRLTHQQFGKSQVPCLMNPNSEVRSDAISEISGEVMLMDHEWKAAINRNGQVYMLFHQGDEPEESANLAGRTEVAHVEVSLRLLILRRLLEAQIRLSRA